MKRATTRSILTLAVALMIVPVTGFAQGINLGWDDCTLGPRAGDKTDACTSNFGPPNKLVVSVNPGGQITNVNGAQGLIDLLVDGASVPDYWRLDAGECRAGNLSADVSIGSANAPFSCPEPWAAGGGNQAGGAGFAVWPVFGSSVPGASRGRIAWVVAIPGTTTLDVATAPDWYLVGINLLRAATSTCAGCATPACLVANEVLLTKPAGTPGGDVLITSAATAQHVTWQGGGTLSCPAAVPVRNRTWGQVKHLYR